MDSIPGDIAFSAHKKAIAHFGEYLKKGVFPSDD
jgi:hypothetical protein